MYLDITFFFFKFVFLWFSPYFSHHVYGWLCLQFKYCTYLVLFVEESRKTLGVGGTYCQ